MPLIDDFKVSRAPGRRTADGERKLKSNYRNVPVKEFRGPLSAVELFDVLFPSIHDA